MKRTSMLMAALAFSASVFAQSEVKTSVKTTADGGKKIERSVKMPSGAAASTETKVRPNGTEVTTTTHKTGRTKVGKKIHKAHMKVKKAL